MDKKKSSTKWWVLIVYCLCGDSCFSKEHSIIPLKRCKLQLFTVNYLSVCLSHSARKNTESVLCIEHILNMSWRLSHSTSKNKVNRKQFHPNCRTLNYNLANKTESIHCICFVECAVMHAKRHTPRNGNVVVCAIARHFKRKEKKMKIPKINLTRKHLKTVLNKSAAFPFSLHISLCIPKKSCVYTVHFNDLVCHFLIFIWMRAFCSLFSLSLSLARVRTFIQWLYSFVCAEMCTYKCIQHWSNNVNWDCTRNANKRQSFHGIAEK